MLNSSPVSPCSNLGDLTTSTMLVLILGLTDSACPVHASSADLCATIQSNLPSRWTTAKEVMGDLDEMRAVTGVVDDIYPRW